MEKFRLEPGSKEPDPGSESQRTRRLTVRAV